VRALTASLVGNVVDRVNEVNQRRIRLGDRQQAGMQPATQVNSAWPFLGG